MSSLRFIKAPPCPPHIDTDAWDTAWIGLEVGLASTWPNQIGYFGTGPARVFDEKTHLYRMPTAAEEFDYLAAKLWKEYNWISRGSLVHECTYSPPGGRPVILSWLEEEAQKNRKIFAVSSDIAEYLP
jgi:hypothetical protein